jgi:hypothetical protein
MTRAKKTAKKAAKKVSSSRQQPRNNIKKRLDTVSKQQQEQKQKVIEQLESIPIIANAIKKVGISRNTFYRWQKEDEQFNQLSQEARARGIEYISDIAESKLIQKIHNGDSPMIRFWLSKNVKRYGGKHTLEIIWNEETLDEFHEKLLAEAVNRWKQTPKRVKVDLDDKKKKKKG